jgi:mRNA interferase MazF
MKKDFDGWNKQKKKVDIQTTPPFPNEREVWWCKLGVNVGSEENGSGYAHARPIVILKGLSTETCLVIPLTTSTDKHKLRPSVGIVGERNARAILSQMRVVDTRRFTSKIGYLDKEIFKEIRKAVKDML